MAGLSPRLGCRQSGLEQLGNLHARLTSHSCRFLRSRHPATRAYWVAPVPNPGRFSPVSLPTLILSLWGPPLLGTSVFARECQEEGSGSSQEAWSLVRDGPKYFPS